MCQQPEIISESCTRVTGRVLAGVASKASTGDHSEGMHVKLHCKEVLLAPLTFTHASPCTWTSKAGSAGSCCEAKQSGQPLAAFQARHGLQPARMPQPAPTSGPLQVSSLQVSFAPTSGPHCTGANQQAVVSCCCRKAAAVCPSACLKQPCQACHAPATKAASREGMEGKTAGSRVLLAHAGQCYCSSLSSGAMQHPIPP
jgi:hypothetical protein